MVVYLRANHHLVLESLLDPPQVVLVLTSRLFIRLRDKFAKDSGGNLIRCLWYGVGLGGRTGVG